MDTTYEWESEDAQLRLRSYGHCFWISLPLVPEYPLQPWHIGIIRAEVVCPGYSPLHFRFPRYAFGHEAVHWTRYQLTGRPTPIQQARLQYWGQESSISPAQRDFQRECDKWSRWILRNSWNSEGVLHYNLYCVEEHRSVRHSY